MAALVSDSPRFIWNAATKTVKIDLAENTAPGTVIAKLSMAEAGFLDIAVGGPDFLDFQVTENKDGTLNLVWQGLSAPDFEASPAPSIDISLDIYAEDKDGAILLDLIEVNTVVSIIDVDEKPTALNITPVVSGLAEGVYEKSVKLADIQIIDDAQGTNTLTPLPADSLFEFRNISGNQAELWLKAGAELDYETLKTITVTLSATGTGQGPNPPAQTYSLTVTNVDEPAELTSAGTIYLDENPAPRQLITTLAARDPDAGDGADRFVLNRNGTGTTTVLDFDASEGDRVRVDTAAGNEGTLAKLGLNVQNDNGNAQIVNANDASEIYMIVNNISHQDVIDNFNSYFEVV